MGYSAAYINAFVSSPPPLKRARTGPSRTRLFFDILPKDVIKDVIELVLKASSRLPNNPNWEAHIALDDVTQLFGVRGVHENNDNVSDNEFRGALQGRFKTLCISNFNNCHREYDDYKWKLRDEPMLWTNDIAAAHNFVLSGGGRSLENLIVGINMYDQSFLGDRIVENFRICCPNIRALSVAEEYRPAWIPRFGHMLDSLEVSTPNHLNVTTYCDHLKHLTFHSYQPCNAFINRPSCLNMCGRSAATLESLTVTGFYLTVRQITDIQRRCRNLKRIRIEAITDEEKFAVAQLLVSYGAGLEWAYVRDFGTAELSRVVDSCKNAKFHLNIVDYDIGLSSISIVGEQLQKLSVHVGAYDGAAPDFTVPWAVCGNLEELDIVGVRNEHMQAIMAEPKHNLRVLNVTIFESARELDVRNIMETCADGTANIEKLSFTACKMPTDTLDKLVKNNRNLGNVVLDYETKNDLRMSEILASCIKSPKLHDITAQYFHNRKMAKKYHERGVHHRDKYGFNFYYVKDKTDTV